MDRRHGTLAPSFLFLVAAALLRHSVGGANAGVTVVTLLPVIVTALHGTRRQLAPVIAGVAAYFVLPVALIGGEQLPAVRAAQRGALRRRRRDDRLHGPAPGGPGPRPHVRGDAARQRPSRTSPSPTRSPGWATAGRGRRGSTPRCAAARHDGEPLCVAIFDLDHFKAYNDANGHPAGDALLAGAATAWRRELRPTDMLARYGGEEFAAVLPACSLDGAHVVVERIRAATPPGRRCRPASPSGTAAEDAEALVARADAALYAAKAAGRDRALAAA